MSSRPRKTRKSCGSFTHTHSPSSAATGRWSGVQLSNSQVRAHAHSLLRYVSSLPPISALTRSYSSVNTEMTGMTKYKKERKCYGLQHLPSKEHVLFCKWKLTSYFPTLTLLLLDHSPYWALCASSGSKSLILLFPKSLLQACCPCLNVFLCIIP